MRSKRWGFIVMCALAWGMHAKAIQLPPFCPVAIGCEIAIGVIICVAAYALWPEQAS